MALVTDAELVQLAECWRAERAQNRATSFAAGFGRWDGPTVDSLLDALVDKVLGESACAYGYRSGGYNDDGHMLIQRRCLVHPDEPCEERYVVAGDVWGLASLPPATIKENGYA